MVRKWHIVRRVLELAEQDKLADSLMDGSYNVGKVAIIDEETFVGHIEILADAGLIKGCDIHRDATGEIVRVNVHSAFVTMAGHDLLDALRDRTVWNAIQEKAKTIGVMVSWEFIKASVPVVLRDLLK
jgi:hypothetical protein